MSATMDPPHTSVTSNRRSAVAEFPTTDELPRATPSPSSSLYLASGAIAGLSVDLVLFPLDTIKTRMQSRGGLVQSGGFAKLFSGIASAAAGSAPTAALFFLTYEAAKQTLTPVFHPTHGAPHSAAASSVTAVNPLVHCLSASLGEVVACLVRVPTENVKQKVQAGLYRSSWDCFRSLLSAPRLSNPLAGPVMFGNFSSVGQNFYRGFRSTILREIPFSFIQFPLYEFGKHQMRLIRGLQQGEEVDGPTCALLGSLAGGIAAAATTPLDVVKTRLMLQRASGTSLGVAATFRSVYLEGGVPRLFSGIVPRVLWISVGGGVFFGAYELSKRKLAAVFSK